MLRHIAARAAAAVAREGARKAGRPPRFAVRVFASVSQSSGLYGHRNRPANLQLAVGQRWAKTHRVPQPPRGAASRIPPSPNRGRTRKPNFSVLAASSYPFLNIFWTILIFFAWVIWIWIAITVLIDVFRRRDISGWAKAAW